MCMNHIFDTPCSSFFAYGFHREIPRRIFFLLHRIFGLHNVLKDNKAYSPRLSRVLSSKTGFPLVRYRDQNSEVIYLQYKTGMKAKLMIMVFNSLIIRCSHGNYSIDIIR